MDERQGGTDGLVLTCTVGKHAFKILSENGYCLRDREKWMGLIGIILRTERLGK